MSAVPEVTGEICSVFVIHGRIIWGPWVRGDAFHRSAELRRHDLRGPHRRTTRVLLGRCDEGYPLAWVHFSSFVLVAVFVLVTLFIAVVLNNLESVQHEQQVETDRRSAHHGVLEAIEMAQQRLQELEERLRATASDKQNG